MDQNSLFTFFALAELLVYIYCMETNRILNLFTWTKYSLKHLRKDAIKSSWPSLAEYLWDIQNRCGNCLLHGHNTKGCKISEAPREKKNVSVLVCHVILHVIILFLKFLNWNCHCNVAYEYYLIMSFSLSCLHLNLWRHVTREYYHDMSSLTSDLSPTSRAYLSYVSKWILHTHLQTQMESRNYTQKTVSLIDNHII